MRPASEVCTVTLSETGVEMIALSKVTRYSLALPILMVSFKALVGLPCG